MTSILSGMELDRRRKRLERDPHERTYLDVEPDFLKRLTSFEKEGENIILNRDRIRSFHEDVEGKEVEFDFRTEESSGTQIVAVCWAFFWRHWNPAEWLRSTNWTGLCIRFC